MKFDFRIIIIIIVFLIILYCDGLSKILGFILLYIMMDFKKPQKPIIGGRSKSSKIPKKLSWDSKTTDYVEEVFRYNLTRHWGQLKLMLSEIEFLTIFSLNKPKTPKKIKVVYPGSADGHHIAFLAQMFNEIEFHLYDPREFHPVLNHLINEGRIHIYKQLFTDNDAKKWQSETKENHILLISDIRSSTHMAGPDAFEDAIAKDMKMQMNWYNIINPDLSIFKFRLPFNKSKMEYLDGDIYLQAFPPVTSTETRLIVKGKPVMREYDAKKYESIMAYHNKYTRVHEYKNRFDHMSSRNKYGLDNRYDSVRFIEIVEDYLKLTGVKLTNQTVLNTIRDIINNMGKFNKLTNRLSFNDKIRFNLMKKYNIVPRNARENIDEFNRGISILLRNPTLVKRLSNEYIQQKNKKDESNDMVEIFLKKN